MSSFPRRRRYPAPGLASANEEEEADEIDDDGDDDGYCSAANLHPLRSRLNEVPVVSQLELTKEYEVLPINGVKEAADGNEKSNASTEKLDICSSEYKVERLTLKGEGQDFLQSWLKKEHHSDSGYESISDEENAVLSNFSYTGGPACIHNTRHHIIETESREEACTWSEILLEADKLVSLPKKTYDSPGTSVSTETRKMRRGGGGKAGLKFSIRSQLHKQLCYSSAVKTKTGHSCEKENNGIPVNVLCHEEIGTVPSMAEMLEDLQEKNGPVNSADDLLLENVIAKPRKTHVPGKRTLSSLGTRELDDQDPSEFMDSGIPNEDEEIYQNDFNFAIQNIKPQTMADIFQEAFITAETQEPVLPMYKQAGTEYHVRLQQIMQVEKDRHMEFLKQLQTGLSSFSEFKCIDVQILSRVLEAKFTVCHCLFSETAKNSQGQDNPRCADSEQTNKVTIIFSTKLCDNVDLEIGNLIRIHPPWKEVCINEDEKIFMCAYFSQIIV